MDVADNKMLIALVAERPELWDKSSKLYRNMSATNKSWKEISSIMNQDETKLKSKWKYFRDQFALDLGKMPPIPPGQDPVWSAAPKKPYFKQLLFLKNVVKPRLRFNPYPIFFSKNKNVDKGIPTTDLQNTQNMDEHVLSSLPTMHQEDESNDEQTSSHMSTHEHMLFFKSLLNHVDRIPEHLLPTFRNRVQDIVEDFAYRSQCIDESMSNDPHLSDNSNSDTSETYHQSQSLDIEVTDNMIQEIKEEPAEPMI